MKRQNKLPQREYFPPARAPHRRPRRQRADFEYLETRLSLSVGFTLLEHVSTPSLARVELDAQTPADFSATNPGPASGTYSPAGVAGTDAASSASAVVSGSLKGRDQLDIYRLSPAGSPLEIELEATSASASPDPARVWLVSQSGDLLADLGTRAGSISVVVPSAEESGLIVAVLHASDFSSAVPVSYRLSLSIIPNLASQTIATSGTTASSSGDSSPSAVYIVSTNVTPVSAPATPTSPAPTPTPPTPAPPAPPPPVAVPEPPSSGSGHTGGHPIDSSPPGGSRDENAGPTIHPLPSLTSAPFTGALAETAAPSNDEAETRLDVARLAVAITRTSVDSELGLVNSPETPLIGIVAQGLVGLAFRGAIYPDALRGLPASLYGKDSTTVAAEAGVEESLPPLGVRSLGPLEGGFSADSRGTAATLPALTVRVPEIAAAPTQDSALVAEIAPPTESATAEKATGRWSVRLTALALNLVSVVLLGAWRPRVIERARKSLRRARWRRLTLASHSKAPR
jgi:hypothetical protein